MCPGDITVSFENNLKEMTGWNFCDNLIKVCFDLERDEVKRSVMTLRRMNVDSSCLFPGLDGFSRSLKERMPLYKDFAKREVGTGDTI